MRIAFVCSPERFNSDYRAYQPMQALARRGHDVSFSRAGAPRFPVAELLRCDVVHVHRYHDNEAIDAARRLKQAGVALVWDNDDDFTYVPDGVRRGGLKSQRAAVGIAQMLGLADVVTAPSSVLAEQYRAGGARRVRVVENYLAPEFVASSARRSERVVVGWAAAGEHRFDLEQLGLRATLRDLLDAHDDVVVASVGLDLGLGHERYRHTSFVPFLELPRQLAEFDVGIAPVADEPFNHARSNIKVKEYAAAGAAWLASPVGPYVGLGEKQGGRLVADDGWRDALERLVSRDRERRKLTKQAAKWGKSQTIDQHVGEWESTFAEAVASVESQSR